MKKIINWIIAIAGFTAGVSSAQPVPVAVGYPPAADWLPALVAKDTGIFEKHGLDVSLSKIAIVSNIPAAIMSGSLNIGATTPTVLIDTSTSGLDLVAVAGATRFVKDPAIFSVVAREGVEVKTAKDLEGKRVGVPGIRSVADVLFRKWLIDKGADMSKVAIVEASFPQMKDLLKAGTIDAVPVLEPFRSAILSDNTGYRVSDYIAEVNEDILGVVWAGSRKWLDANPTVVPAFRLSLAEALDFIRDNPEKAREIEKKYLGFTTQLKVPYSLTLNPAEFDIYANMFKEVGFVDKAADTSGLIYR
ncbi:ABC transporter substrate-binding protein [Pusillimonas noertemannii]|uniref:NitT/TauT family transport system substrate-binding protein n=1 Tax=Pusillimonas noertemannii TaxID=305977 RepID=A0A2U1CP81_9BURK|nr:ABC transporter substrate-binding protein [Pusillimonas noertemannii]NYT67016.1 ABC transporter substrate-binding protein [Pusillimonas noertemannii]PVY67689.1 NitT/TauT family transport system substrate-binding protein [Pusillimonas noertemannii]TFL12774.1 ABC transporter substrate-binding protein [Pusillimonas noertemannii]